MSEPLKSIHVRLSADFYERIEIMAHCQQRDVANLARAFLEKAICGEWYHFEKKAKRLVGDVDQMGKGNTMQSKSARGFLYVIRVGDLYKIGKTVNTKNRIRGMALPEKPEIICTIETPDRHLTERTWHKTFKEYRRHGEWFQLPPHAVAQIAKGVA